MELLFKEEMKMDYSKLTNSEIKNKMKTMKEEYEAVKQNILSLYAKLDEYDKEYILAEEELKIRNMPIDD